jgi:Cu(I)/Ag(I) efflux system membrane fusion protein/cobalt-zinc-cadmium efflux system membrane fusion protein
MKILTCAILPALLLLLLVFGLFPLSTGPSTPAEALHLLSHAHADEKGTKYTCSMHPTIVMDEPGSCPICGMDLVPMVSQADEPVPTGERQIKYWVAPMDPTYIRNEPGKSPMGMDLVPVYEGEGIGSTIRIDPVTMQNMGIRTAPVLHQNLERTIRTVGIVGYEEPRQYSINAKVDGWIEKLYIAETGRAVRKGDPLLEIYSPALVSAQEEYLLAVANNTTLAHSSLPAVSGGAQRLLDAARRRLKLWDISDRQIDRLEKSGQVEKTMTLYAEYKGVVTRKQVQQGQYIKSGMELLQLADISRVWVYADIYEYELPWVKVGQQVEVVLPFVGGKTISGEVSTIYPFVEARTRTVKARIDLVNTDLTLKPDMYVHVRLQVESRGLVLTIPAEAVLYTGEEAVVFIALEGGKFEPRRVKVGMKDDSGHIEVIQGLFEGEQVVTSGQFMLDSESKLRAAVSRMTEPKSTAVEPHVHADQESAGELFGTGGKKKELDDLFR